MPWTFYLMREVVSRFWASGPSGGKDYVGGRGKEQKGGMGVGAGEMTCLQFYIHLFWKIKTQLILWQICK